MLHIYLSASRTCVLCDKKKRNISSSVVVKCYILNSSEVVEEGLFIAYESWRGGGGSIGTAWVVMGGEAVAGSQRASLTRTRSIRHHARTHTGLTHNLGHRLNTQ